MFNQTDARFGNLFRGVAARAVGVEPNAIPDAAAK